MNRNGSSAVASEKYLSFGLSNEEYGIEILKVQEIIGMMKVTVVPRTAPYVRGVINLRGKIIPVVDLRQKFGMACVEVSPETCIIVVSTQEREIGLIVDRVLEVTDVPLTDIDAPPNFGADLNTGFLTGIAKTGGKVKLLIAIDQVINTQGIVELPQLETLESRRPSQRPSIQP